MSKCELSLKQTFNINFGLFGVYFAWILQMANMSGIFAFRGAPAASLGKLWLALPVGGLFVQLFVGYLSDKTKSYIESSLNLLPNNADFKKRLSSSKN